MKKLLLLILGTTLIFSSCSKWEDNPAVNTEYEVVFKSVAASLNNLKATCDNPDAQYAFVKVKHTTSGTILDFYPEVFYLGGTAYTQSIKLKPGTWEILEFVLMSDNFTPGNTGDDIVIQATPQQGAAYADFISNPLPFTTQVAAFEKNEIPIEVLCFEETEYEGFGFRWFMIDQVSVREQVFFGDLCAKHPEDYAGSLYANQINGVQIDMPAIFKIDVYNNNTFVESFNNASWFGEGQPLKVRYVDNNGEVNHFRFELFILVQDGVNFTYKKFYTWEFDDAERISAGQDNVVDFVLGNCNTTDADLILAPYISLPATATYQAVAWLPNSTLGAYVDAKITNVGGASTKYELYNGTWPSWCADKNTTIGGGQYNMDVYSSLYPNLIPVFARHAQVWPMVNWLMNNLHYYPTASIQDIQDALWILLNNYTGGSSLAHTIATQASQYGVGYVPLPGGWAAVVFVPHGTPPTQAQPDIQTMFIRVDP
ncbi:MAG: hypothetical protein CVU00_02870 [Bacteroidetes bacterium HGW-Bacteroidetes-17]|jgi:hypothetical protein|nr:MAG: hypothetical protein CVU00_02870 [Bacteroidetes bacterium HGW-Bacteroidetes-17]